MSDYHTVNAFEMSGELRQLTQAQEMLLVMREEQMEMSREQGEIVNLGMLRGDTPPEHWAGTISLQTRLESGELTREEVNTATAKLDQFFVEAKVGAPKRCGDGRFIEGFDVLDPAWYTRGLGVQILGGTAGDAIGIRLAKGYEPGSTFAHDVEVTAKEHESDFAPGDHTDDHAEGEKTGCGAIDGQVRKNEIFVDPGKSKTLKSILTFVYDKAGLPIPLNLFRQLKQSTQDINEHSSDYFEDKHHALGAIQEQNSNGIEPLVGKHNEVSLTLNFVEGTTFDRDSYNAETDGKIQNFNVDVWAILKEHGEDAGFVLADMIATALDLTDGTLEVFARVPRSKPQTDFDTAA